MKKILTLLIIILIYSISVNASLNIINNPITGSAAVCLGSTVQLSDNTSGGVFTSGDTTIAKVDNTGLVKGIAAGTVTIKYTISNSNVTDEFNITVNSLPNVNISGPTNFYQGISSNLIGTPLGGTWNSNDNAVASIDLNGKVNVNSVGNTVISYSYTDNITGCINSKEYTIQSKIFQYCGSSETPDYNNLPGNNLIAPCSGYVINVFFHNIGDQNGIGRVSNADINAALLQMQRDFAPMNISIVEKGRDEIWNNYASSFVYYTNSGQKWGEFLPANNIFNTQSLPAVNYDAIDIYISPTYNGGLAIHEGLAFVIGHSDDIGDILFPSHIVSHELGHCLGLYHTFEGTCGGHYGTGQELVNGTNGDIAGDLVKDTYADPANLTSYIDNSTGLWLATPAASCTGLITDANGQQYCPDETNIMSYNYPVYMNHFTEGQGLRMRTSIANSNTLQNALISSTILTGKIINAYPNGRKGVYLPIKNAISQLTDLNLSSNNLMTTNTNNKGYYQFPTIVSSGNVNYSLTPFKNPNLTMAANPYYDQNTNNYANGVSLLDVSLIKRHILQVNNFQLNSPYKMLAADVNGDGKINTFDIVNITQYLLGKEPTFWGKDNNLNKIDRGLFGFITQPSAVNLQPIPFVIWQFPNYNTPYFRLNSFANSCNQPSNDFYGFELGDVTWDWNPVYQKNVDNTIKPVTLYYDDIDATSSEQIKVPVKVKNFNALVGMQFTLNFNPYYMELKEVNNLFKGMDYNINKAEKGELTFLWTDENTEGVSLDDNSVLFELIFKKKEGLVKTDIIINNNTTAVQVIDKNLAFIPLEKNGGSIYTNRINENNEKGNWKIVSPYSIEGTIFIQVHAVQDQDIRMQLFNHENKLLLDIQKSVRQGTNTLYANLRSMINLEAGSYSIVLKGLSNDMSQSIVIGSDRQNDPIEDIAIGNITVPSNNEDLTLYALQTQLYYRLINDPSINNTIPIIPQNPRLCDVVVPSGPAIQFLANNKNTSFNTIYQIDYAMTNGKFEQAKELLLNWSRSNEIDNNYYQYFQWVFQIISNQKLGEEDIANLNNQILACPLTAGMVVYSSRDLFNYINNTHIVFEDACGIDNNTGSKKVKTTTVKSASMIRTTQEKQYTINVYPNPTSGKLNIELPIKEKGNWKITLNDVYGKTIQEIFVTEGSTNETMNIKEASGLYFLNITNLTSGKQENRKIMLK